STQPGLVPTGSDEEETAGPFRHRFVSASFCGAKRLQYFPYPRFMVSLEITSIHNAYPTNICD
ncbi:MAG: hypothetical protein ABL921_19245, partial [Pirellula sp.]